MACDIEVKQSKTNVADFELWKAQCGFNKPSYKDSDKRVEEAYNTFVKQHIDISGVALASKCAVKLVEIAVKLAISDEVIINCLNSTIYTERYNCSYSIEELHDMVKTLLKDIVK